MRDGGTACGLLSWVHMMSKSVYEVVCKRPSGSDYGRSSCLSPVLLCGTESVKSSKAKAVTSRKPGATFRRYGDMCGRGV